MSVTLAERIEGLLDDENTEEQSDKLSRMFQMRENFMRSLRAVHPGTYPIKWPVDITQKDSQRLCRDLALHGVEEIFEATTHLKNAKSHRTSEVTDIDRDAVLEEMVDAFNYFLSMLILMGFTEQNLFEMFVKKDKIIHERLTNGY